jgi:hypothetical protein
VYVFPLSSKCYFALPDFGTYLLISTVPSFIVSHIKSLWAQTYKQIWIGQLKDENGYTESFITQVGMNLSYWRLAPVSKIYFSGYTLDKVSFPFFLRVTYFCHWIPRHRTLLAKQRKFHCSILSTSQRFSFAEVTTLRLTTSFSRMGIPP